MNNLNHEQSTFSHDFQELVNSVLQLQLLLVKRAEDSSFYFVNMILDDTCNNLFNTGIVRGVDSIAAVTDYTVIPNSTTQPIASDGHWITKKKLQLNV